MSTQSNIQWTDATWNPVAGCTRVNSDCNNCYAVAMTHRLEAMGQPKYSGLTVLNNKGHRHFNGVVHTDDAALTIPLGWRKPRRIFVNSMSDLFHKEVGFDFVDQVMTIIACCPQHTFQILTKRPERAFEYFKQVGLSDIGPRGHRCQVWSAVMNRAEHKWMKSDPDYMNTVRPLLFERLKAQGPLPDGPLPNLWLGTSCGHQDAADQMIPHLLRCPAAVRFLSVEPMTGPIEFSNVSGRSDAVSQLGKKAIAGIHWVIVGGESGPGARPCNVAWIRSIIEQCQGASVPCFVKQLGKWISGDHDFRGWKGKIDRWLLADDKGNTSTYSRPILRGEYCPQFYDERPANAIAWGLNDPKGGNMTEWPTDLQVREMPS